MPAGGTINAHIEMRIADGRDWSELDGTLMATASQSVILRYRGRRLRYRNRVTPLGYSARPARTSLAAVARSS